MATLKYHELPVPLEIPHPHKFFETMALAENPHFTCRWLDGCRQGRCGQTRLCGSREFCYRRQPLRLPIPGLRAPPASLSLNSPTLSAMKVTLVTSPRFTMPLTS